jgi:hypothetical protein
LLGICAGLVCGPAARAGDTGDSKATPAATPEEEPKNWIELGVGGTIVNGDDGQFQQEHRLPADTAYGGIQDMHYEQKVGEKAQLAIDGHALWDINDYDVKLDLSQPDLGYFRAGITEFRNWYDGNGGWFPHNGGVFFEPPIPEMHIDRGEVWAELGLQLPDWPELVFHYSHIWRQGEKDSTIWGDTTLTGLAINPARKIAPAYRDIDEKRDFFTFDATKAFGDTTVTLGMRYEHDDNDDKLQLERGAGQLPPAVAPPGAQRFITQADNTDTDMYSGHIFSETHIKDWLWFTTGYSYTTSNVDLTGSRVVGPFYNAGINDPILTLQSNDHSFVNLAGTATTNEHIFNANVLFIPFKEMTVLSGFRYTYDNTDADSMFLDINTTANVAPFNPVTNPQGGFHRTAPVPHFETSSNHMNNFSERLEMRYTGIENWLFYAEGEWEDEFGNVKEHEIIHGVDQGMLNKDPGLVSQKYTIGANWYPTSNLAVSGQFYYKIDNYDTDFNSELATPPVANGERNQRLLGQDWQTQDANIRITWRPKIPQCLGTMSLVTRFDFVQSAISGKWAISPTQTGSGLTNTILEEERTGLVTNYMATETLDWNPLPRLFFQENFSYVLDQTKSPVNNIDLIATGTTLYPSPSVITARNDYWTLTGTAGYLIDDKTEVTALFTYYRAPDWFKNPVVGMPYGIGASESTASIGLSREIAKNVRLNLKYTYFNYADETFGGHNNYRGHSIYSGLQFRF